MKTRIFVIFASLFICVVSTAAAPAQTLPKVWNRYADWVDKKNPTLDSKGNTIWYCYHRKSYVTLGTVWDKTWGGWIYGSSRWAGAAPITRGELHHLLHNTTQFGVLPEVWFVNTTTKSFLVKVEGKLTVDWIKGTRPSTPKVLVRIEHIDISQKSKRTTLYSATVAPNSTLSVTLPVSASTIRMDSNDSIRVTVGSLTSASLGNRVKLVDKSLNFVRKSVALATETVRNATPNNPLILNEGRSSRPIIGKTWDPYLSKVPAGATSNIIAIGVTKKHMPMPYGTLLTDPILLVYGPVGADFKFPIANNVAFAGITASLQGATITKSGGLLLSNALDIQVGDF